jgi:hypothetical protein
MEGNQWWLFRDSLGWTQFHDLHFMHNASSLLDSSCLCKGINAGWQSVTREWTTSSGNHSYKAHERKKGYMSPKHQHSEPTVWKSIWWKTINGEFYKYLKPGGGRNSFMKEC